MLLPIIGVLALPPAALELYVHRLLKKRPLEMLYEQRASQSDFVPLNRIPARMVALLTEMEDSEFYLHHGFIPENIKLALEMNLQEKKVIWGGSTITQQLVKNLYFDFSKSFLRKAAELVLAVEAEKRLGKDRILEFYMNIIYFGNGVYGISDAARFYFGKDVSSLTLNQMFMLACMPYAPTKGNPIQHPEVFERIRDKRMKRFAGGPTPSINEEEAALIMSYHADRLDPELRQADEWTRYYPQDVPLKNERFGPFDVPLYRNPMETAR